MANIFNDDFRDFIHTLNQNNVRYILVGGYSVILHGYNRTTGDMDIWVEKSEMNYQQLLKAFKSFGMPVFDMTLDNFLNNPTFDVFTFGRPPSSIDIMTAVKGVSFDEAFVQSKIFIEDNLSIRFIHLNHLIAAKKAAGRHKDLNDIENLTET